MTEQYRWRDIPIGGGGFLQDVVPHPTRPAELYVSSDMTGPFIRRTPEEPFVNAAHFNPQLSEGADVDAITGLAIHPDKPDTLFVNVVGPGLMRSTDAGRTYHRVHPVQSFTKHMGPTIAIDPANANVVFRGTQKDGLYRSLQGGDPDTWQRLEVTPAGADANHFVVIPKGGPIRDGRSQTIYVGVRGHGIFVSNDGGDSFAKVSAAGPETNNVVGEGAEVELLIEPLAGTSGQMPRDWNPEQSSMRNGVVLGGDDSRRWLTPVRKGAMLERVIELPVNVVEVTMTFDVRTQGLEVGPKLHETLIGAVDFILADGARHRASWKKNIFVKPGQDDWTPQKTTIEVPQNSRSMVIKFGSQAKAGTGQFSNIAVRARTGAPRAVDLNPTSPRQLRTDSTGALYVAHDAGLLRFSPSTGWTDITPTPLRGKNVRGFDVHPGNPQWMLAIQSYVIYRSQDGGANWQELPTRGDKARIVTRERARWFHFAVSAAGCLVVFDPHEQGRVWIADAFMLWQTDDIWAEKPVFDAQWRGIENTVPTQITVSPRPDGQNTELIATYADIRGLRFTTSLESPEESLAQSGHVGGIGGDDMASVATSEQHPLRWYGALNRGWKGPGALIRSDDGGRKWQKMPNPIPDQPNHGGAKIAVSSGDPDTLIYLPGMKLTPRFSTDGGKTWADTQGLPWINSGDRNFNFDSNVAADTVEAGVFYAFSNHPDQGGLYLSRDGGKSWSPAGGKLPARRGGDNYFAVSLVAKPGAAGHLAISIGREGVWLSRDYGQTLSRLEPFTGGECTGVAYGAPAAGSDQPVLYVQNYWNGEQRRGVFRSMDDGQTWARIDDPKLYIDQPTLFTASRQVFGRVYLADLGQALMVGELREDK